MRATRMKGRYAAKRRCDCSQGRWIVEETAVDVEAVDVADGLVGNLAARFVLVNKRIVDRLVLWMMTRLEGHGNTGSSAAGLHVSWASVAQRTSNRSRAWSMSAPRQCAS